MKTISLEWLDQRNSKKQLLRFIQVQGACHVSGFVDTIAFHSPHNVLWHKLSLFLFHRGDTEAQTPEVTC